MDFTRYQSALRMVWAFAVMVVIWLTLLPSTSLPIRELALLHINDKVEHFGAYTALAFLPTLHERRRFLFLAALGLVALGVLLEFGQLHSFGRQFEVRDMVADAMGVLIGVAIAWPMRAAKD